MDACSSSSSPSLRLLPLSRGHLPRDSCVTPADRRAQTPTAATEAERLGSLLLAHPAASVATLGRCSGPGETRDRGQLASGRLSLVLARALPTPRRAAQN